MAKSRQPAAVDRSRGLLDPAALDRLIRSCEETARYCDDCAAGGLDVTPEARKNADQLTVAKRLKAAFFPDRK